MKFWQRLLRYLIGFGLGCSLVFWMFPNYDWLGWLPGKQIRQQIQQSSLQFSTKSLCVLQQQMIKEADWRKVLEDGAINFEKSNTHEKEKLYQLESDVIYMRCLIQDTITQVLEISRIGVPINEECLNP